MSVTAAVFSSMLMFQDITGTAVAKPVGEVILEPESGSYFQIFEFFGRPPHSWQHAARMVRGYLYQEREGRLAHVTSSRTHYFLLSNFTDIHFKPMWIGLKVTCREEAEIKWTDGTDLSQQTFRAWNEGNLRKISRTCRGKKHSGFEMPVYYDAHELGVRWELGGSRTNLQHMMVEFPVPAEETEKDVDAEVSDEGKN